MDIIGNFRILAKRYFHFRIVSIPFEYDRSIVSLKDIIFRRLTHELIQHLSNVPWHFYVIGLVKEIPVSFYFGTRLKFLPVRSYIPNVEMWCIATVPRVSSTAGPAPNGSLLAARTPSSFLTAAETLASPSW